MRPFDLFGIPLWTVSELTDYLSNLIESDELLQELWVQGEVSNFSRPASGHLYFTLKDRQSSLRCVMWRSDAMRLSTPLIDGQFIEAHGRIKIYPPGGVYQLYVDRIQTVGEGRLFQEFLNLKKRLEAEGLFEQSRKKPLPEWPQTIGVITSATGAAIRDILRTISRRFPLATVILAPASVQGTDAPPELIQALEKLNDLRVEVIILARGGGSIEDLWAFNDEGLARAIARSAVPVITGVGHETDFTIADFVSDMRAPTPTAAAELATPNIEEISATLLENQQQLRKVFLSFLQYRSTQLHHLNSKLNVLSPMRSVQNNQQRLDEFSYRLALLTQNHLEKKRSSLQNLAQKLIALNPNEVLRRGYAVVQTQAGAWVTRIKQILPQEPVVVTMYDGHFDAEVKEVVLDDERG